MICIIKKNGYKIIKVKVTLLNGVRATFRKHYDVSTYDINTELSTCDTLQELVTKSDVIFVCVPTPMNGDGSCNISIVEEVCSQCANVGDDHIIVIKSTIPPGTTKGFNAKFNTKQIVFNIFNERYVYC